VTDEASQAQRRLDEARRQHAAENPRRQTGPGLEDQIFTDFRPTPEQLARFRELKAEVGAAPELQGIDSEIADLAISFRAAQLLREEIDPDWSARREREALELARQALAERIRHWRIPKLHRDAILTGYDEHGTKIRDTEPEADIDVAVGDGLRLIVLVGPLGTGKTMAAIRWAAGSDHNDVLYSTARQVFAKSDRYDGDRPDLERVNTCAVLILDEMAGQEERDADSAQIASVLHHRWENKRITICIANTTQEEFEGKYEPRVVSRLWEAGEVIPCTVTLRRGEKARQQELGI
jgi:hypothetical protein